MTANETQVGGSHYKSLYEHWDLAVTIPLSYLEGCITKYVTRARKKNGIQDLKKATHYLEKLIEVSQYPVTRKLDRAEIKVEISRFCVANSLSLLEEEFILIMCTHRAVFDLMDAQFLLEEIIEELEIKNKPKVEMNIPGTPEDGGNHAP